MKVIEIERDAAAEVARMLEEIRENIEKMGRAQAMESLCSVNMLMCRLAPQATATMFTIVAFQLAESQASCEQ